MIHPWLTIRFSVAQIKKDLNNGKMKSVTMEKHTQEISKVKRNLDKEKTKYVTGKIRHKKNFQAQKELETENDKSLSMDKLKKNLESTNKLQSILMK